MVSRHQRIAAIALTALGLYVTIYTLVKLDVGSLRKPGSGFFTLICGVGILLFSVIMIVGTIKTGVKKEIFWPNGSWRKPVLALISVTIYAYLIPVLGYILSTAAFLLVWEFIVEKQKVVTTLIFTVIGSVTMWFLFEKLLAVPLPNGLLPW